MSGTGRDAQPTAAFKGRRVLVADADFLGATLLEDMLGELEAEPLGAVATSAEIVPAVERYRAEAVTLDLDLAGDRVYDAADRLRERGVPFVFVSDDKGLDGCPDHLRDAPRLHKPFGPSELAGALEAALARGGRA